MKKIIFAAFLGFLSHTSYSQSEFDEEVQRVTSYTCRNGWTIKEGDTLKLGIGTMANRDFAYIYIRPNLLTYQPLHLGAGFSGLGLKVKRIKEIKLKGVKKPEIVVGAGNIMNNWVDIEQAIETGEILPPEQYRKKPETAQVTIQQTSSIADEIVKLKKLLDKGILNQEEYDNQKKKLLGQ